MKKIDDAEKDKMIGDKGLAFFGAITASVSHELNNVISIIDQSAGLLSDLLIGAKHGKSIEDAKLQRIADTIDNQTKRGVGIIKRMNSFAHSADVPEGEFELNGLIENLTALCQRFADMKRVRIKISDSSAKINMFSNPFHVEQALFLCIQWSLATARAADVIEIKVATDNDHVLLTVVSRLPDEDQEIFDIDYLRILIQQIRGEVDTVQSDAELKYQLRIPVKPE